MRTFLMLSRCFRTSLLAPATTVALWPASASAHRGELVAPGDASTAWHFDPWIVIALMATTYLYFRGTALLWRRSGVGTGVGPWQVGAFVAGMLVLAVALIGPLDPLGETLFSAHMAQHLALMMAAAPLLVIGAPRIPMIWGMPQRLRPTIAQTTHRLSRSRGVQWMLTPVAAVTVAAGVMWLWHVPALYEAALESQAVHILEHITMFGSAFLFWWVVLRPSPHARAGYGISILALFAMAMAGSALGALLATSRTVWFEAHAVGAAMWDMTPLEDQQLAGIIMWVPSGAVYLIATLWLVAAWLEQIERRSAQRQPGVVATPGAEGGVS